MILQLFSKTWEKKEKEYKDIVNFAAKENQNLLCWKIRHLHSVTINIFIDIKVNLPNQNTGF